MLKKSYNMKNILFLMFLTALMSGCMNNSTHTEKEQATEAAPEPVSDENLLSIRFDVNGMTCNSCEQTISKGVKALPGIVEVKASYQDSTALVKFDKSKTSIADITSAIESKGYEVEGYQLDME